MLIYQDIIATDLCLDDAQQHEVLRQMAKKKPGVMGGQLSEKMV